MDVKVIPLVICAQRFVKELEDLEIRGHEDDLSYSIIQIGRILRRVLET